MSKKNKVLLMSAAMVVYLLIGGSLALMLHDKMPVAVIAVINYAVAAAVFAPVFPFLFGSRKEENK